MSFKIGQRIKTNFNHKYPNQPGVISEIYNISDVLFFNLLLNGERYTYAYAREFKIFSIDCPEYIKELYEIH